MARRVNAPDPETANANLADEPPMQGGSPGVIESAVSTLSEPGKAAGSVPEEKRSVEHLPPAKRWIVERGGRVMYAGCGVDIKVGKVIAEGHYDVALLRRQGIVLKEI
jgi:hypothetical protein